MVLFCILRTTGLDTTASRTLTIRLPQKDMNQILKVICQCGVLFWDVVQHRMIVGYQCFGTAC